MSKAGLTSITGLISLKIFAEKKAPIVGVPSAAKRHEHIESQIQEQQELDKASESEKNTQAKGKEVVRFFILILIHIFQTLLVFNVMY